MVFEKPFKLVWGDYQQIVEWLKGNRKNLPKIKTHSHPGWMKVDFGCGFVMHLEFFEDGAARRIRFALRECGIQVASTPWRDTFPLKTHGKDRSPFIIRYGCRVFEVLPELM